MSIKSEIILILAPIFGDNIKNIVENQYDDPKEIIQMAKHMLTGYMGEKNAEIILERLIKKNKVKT